MGIVNAFKKRNSEEGLNKIQTGTPARPKEVFSGKWKVGDRIENRYEIHDIRGGPGKSGMGIVYVCYDREYKVLVAIKTFQDRFLKDHASINRFKWEAEAWVRLEKHHNIVQAKYVMEIDGRPYVFLEYVVGDEQYGTDLSGWIWGGGLTLPLTLNFSIQFCHGMIYANRKFKETGKPFVHRDIKPSNIMITQDRVVKITDFGLVKAFAESGEDISSAVHGDESHQRLGLSKSGNRCGTPPYMSPEQCRGETDIDSRSDIYSFGCVLYEMLTRRNVFEARTIDEFIYHHLNTIPRSPKAHQTLDNVVLKCLKKEPVQRFQTFEELEEVLSELYHKLTGEVVKPPEGTALEVWELGNKGASLGTLGFHEEAVACLQQALTLDPSDYEVHVNLGVAYCNQGKADEGISEYRKALELYPNDARAHNNLGRAYFYQGRLDEAVSEYNEALRLNPNLAEAHTKLGYVRIEKFAKFAAATMIDPLLKHGRRGPSEVDRQMALRPVGMAFTLGFVLAKSHRAELEKVLDVSLESLSKRTEFEDMSREARARGDNLIEILLGTALNRLSVLNAQSVDIALAKEEVSNAYELGLKAGLVLPAIDPTVDREFREVTGGLKLHPGDDVIHLIIRRLLKEYDVQLRNEPS
jgi:tetratricopeptide (TPR) repeat protein/tRNA A-37 threonylcarbamoyl transferase component Bud32